MENKLEFREFNTQVIGKRTIHIKYFEIWNRNFNMGALKKDVEGWEFDSLERYYKTSELRQIADKLDELNGVKTN